MIKFFRNIRKSLLAKNLPAGKAGKTGKYFKYAIGEIVLVVLGILIALQINNWNLASQRNKKEIYYLNSIKSSIELSQNELNRVINDAEIISSCADTLLKLIIHKKQDQINGYELDSLLFNSSDYSLMSLNDAGIQEILSTSSLDIIKDKRIRVFLASWDERIHKIRKHEEVTKDLSVKYESYLDHYIDQGRYFLDSSSVVIPQKKNALLSDPQLRNYLSDITWIHSEMYERYSDEKASLDTLKILIDNYLSQ